MNKQWILSHLQEAHDELTRTIARLNAIPCVDEIELKLALAHVYGHLNTAWNSRAATDPQIAVQSDEDFDAWRMWPGDISMGH